MIEVYSIELNEEEAIRYYANKFIENALEDCSEFNYCLYIDQNHEHREFIINHKEQILDRIKKDEKVADVYIDEENEELSFNMVFWIDYCPYYYEESNIGISDEINNLKLFEKEILNGVSNHKGVTTTREVLRHFIDSILDKYHRLSDEFKDNVYYNLKEHICNTGFNEKYREKYEVYIDRNNAEELIEGLENEIDKLYIKKNSNIKQITYYQFLEILNKHNKEIQFKPNDLGKFITKENGIYLGINNTNGEMKMQDFDDIKKCLNYLNEDLEYTENFEDEESEEL